MKKIIRKKSNIKRSFNYIRNSLRSIKGINNILFKSTKLKINLSKFNFLLKELLDSFSNKNIFSWKYIFLITLIYSSFAFSCFYIIARDRYFVESSIIVRKPNKGSVGTSNLLSFIGGGSQQTLEDAKYLEIYLESPEVLEILERDFNFNDAYQKKGLDIFSGLRKNAHIKMRHQYFKKIISFKIDETSGIAKIKVSGFNSEDAFRINNFLLKQSDIFINNLNKDIYKKQLAFSKSLVNSSKQRLDKEIEKLKELQSNYEMINAEYEAQSILNIIGALENQLLELKVKLSNTKRNFLRDDDPEIQYLTNQLTDLQSQIDLERKKLASSNKKALNIRKINLNEIENNIIFLREIYKSSLAKSEENRVESIQQQRFLALISKPYKIEIAENNWRHINFLTSIVGYLIFISLVRFIFGITISHAE